MNRPVSDLELKDAIRELAPRVETSTFCEELGERCAKKKPGRHRGRRFRLVAIGAVVVVMLTGASLGLIIGLGYLRGPQSVIVLSDDVMSPGTVSQGPSGPYGSPANTLSGTKAELWTEIQRIRQGVASGELVFDWPSSEAASGVLTSDPMLMLDSLEQELLGPDVTAYLRDSADEALALRTKVWATPGVARLEFVNKEEALARLKNSFSDNPEILEGLDDNPLPASLEIWLSDYTQAAFLADELRGRPEVEEVAASMRDDAYWIERLDYLRSLTRPSDSTNTGATRDSAETGSETTTTYGAALTGDDPPPSSTTTIMGDVGPRLTWGEMAILDGRTIKVEQPVEAPDETGAPSGFTVAYSMVTITNTGSEPLICVAAEFSLEGNSSGSTGHAGPKKMMAGHVVLDRVTLQPGESVTAAVRFCVKQGDHPVKVRLGTQFST